MPEYLTPGVYVEEVEIGPKPIEGVPTSTAAFVGETLRGTSKPSLVTSFLDYRRKFGGHFGADQYMPHAVQGFFENGGSRCYVCRVVGEGALASSLDIGGVLVTALGEGTSGDNIVLKVTSSQDRPQGFTEPNAFRLQLFFWARRPDDFPYDPEDPTNRDRPPPDYSEAFNDLVITPGSPNHFEKRVNEGMSALVQLSGAPDALPGTLEVTPLAGGEDGDAPELADYVGAAVDPLARRGLSALEQSAYRDVALLYAPNAGSVPGLTDALMSHCERNKYRFAVLDSPQAAGPPGDLDPRTTERPSKYAAYYYPWIRVIDPLSGLPKLVPPGGHVTGIYARSDNERGVWKAPANEIVRGSVDLQLDITDGEQAVLNPRGINVLRGFPGRGRRVWGARTLSADPLWKYVNVRRLFIFIEASIDRNTQWVVFEPNNERLWSRVTQTITQFLRAQWRAGALMGQKEGEAFFVKADRETMSQDDIDNGRLVVVIGVAPVKPAEFVIFRIAQFTAGANS